MRISKNTRTTVGFFVFFACVLMMAWNGKFTWLEIMATGVMLSVPAVIKVVELYLNRKDSCELDHDSERD